MMIVSIHHITAQNPYRWNNGCNQQLYYNTYPQQYCDVQQYNYNYDYYNYQQRPGVAYYVNAQTFFPQQQMITYQAVSPLVVYQTVPVSYLTTATTAIPTTYTTNQSSTISVQLLIRGSQQTVSFSAPANAGYTYIDYSPVIMYHADRCEITFIDDKNTPRKVTYSYPTIN